jgi:hypothetical protein
VKPEFHNSRQTPSPLFKQFAPQPTETVVPGWGYGTWAVKNLTDYYLSEAYSARVDENKQITQGTKMTLEKMLGNLHAMALHTAPPKPLPKIKK